MNNKIFIEEKIVNIPNQSGIYLFKDSNSICIYIGKANNLYSRVKSYFRKNTPVIFTNHIYDIEYIITNNKIDALLLEQNLIKKYQPKYNILFKDDKRYPYIYISNEKYPRILYERKIQKNNKGVYYGPFPDGLQAKKILDLLNRIYPFRKCHYLPKKSCIYYDLKQCLAPCINDIDTRKYDVYKKQIDNFFAGNNKYVLLYLKAKLDKYSDKLEYEKAAEVLKMINNIKILHSSDISSNFIDNKNRDVLGYAILDNYISIVLLLYRSGQLLNVIKKMYLYIDDFSDIVNKFLFDYYISNITPDYLIAEKKVEIYEICNIFKIKNIINNSKYSQLIKLANKNATSYLTQNINNYLTKISNINTAWNELSNIVNIKNLSFVDIYDNSNINGLNFVSASQTYYQGVIVSKYTRKFKLPESIKDDLAAMQYILKKKFLMSKNYVIPDLIIVDGGKLQVNAVIYYLKVNNFENIKVMGLQKNEHHKTEKIYFAGNYYPLKKNSVLYLFLFAIQDKIHKTVISYFRKKFISNLFETSLKDIVGVGDVTANKLLNSFSSFSDLKSSSIEKLNLILNNKELATSIYNYYKLEGENDK